MQVGDGLGELDHSQGSREKTLMAPARHHSVAGARHVRSFRRTPPLLEALMPSLNCLVFGESHP